MSTTVVSDAARARRIGEWYRLVSRDRQAAAHNCGPTRTEILRTAPAGVRYLVAPRAIVDAWLRTESPLIADASPGDAHAHESLACRAVPAIARVLGLEPPALPFAAVERAALLLEWLHGRLRERAAFPTLVGWVRGVDERSEGPLLERSLETWPPADPSRATTAAARATAAAVALLLPAVVAPPLLLWRRRPLPERFGYDWTWLVQVLASDGGPRDA